MEQLRLRAHAQAQEGDARLAEFCTVHTEEELQNYLAGAWAVHDAPQTGAQGGGLHRVAKLRAAAAKDCTCGGVWEGHIKFIFANNSEDVKAFCADVLEALTLGACRGVNLAIVGPPGCGKSTVFEAMDLIYNVCGKPERDNSFPLAGVLDAEVLIWHEFSWEPKMCAYEDILNLMCGEKIGIRVPHKKPPQFKNQSPMFYTAWEPLTYRGPSAAKARVYNEAMDERFKMRRWVRPLPKEGRIKKFPHCAHCFASFILNNA